VELVMVIFAVVVMVRVADAENRSGSLWGAVTFLLCMLSLAIPLPFLRVLIALGVSLGALFVSKMLSGR